MVYSPGDDESRDRRAEVGSRVVPELGDERVSIERRLNEAALNTAASPVHEAHVAQTGQGGGVYVVCDHAATSRGAKACRSISASMGMRMGSSGMTITSMRNAKCRNAKCGTRPTAECEDSQSFSCSFCIRHSAVG